MANWQQLNQRYQALQLREKRLIFFGSVVLVFWLLLMYLLEPAWQQQQQLTGQQQKFRLQQQQVRQQLELLQLQLAVDIEQPFRDEINRLTLQQTELTSQRQQQSSLFIGADQMLALLREILGKSQQLKLKSLSTSAAVPVVLAGQLVDEAPLLYQHKTTLVVSGAYQNVQQLLSELEQLPWLVQWQQLDYQVTEYPLADISIEFITVSENENFIQL
ncbi:MSHA biogenesis protein MshJ [Arsukibacterium tuosuense]|uniref:MSHA biogenesis protein MshJ n=1 Tax=Arsukibacterium tuosuense TaxID=1323745 RepID=A0A285JDB6_9GAMM|nr:type II secretion system protein M [Arsukibacterium tuosuense]SNY58258.1 MSHA biogenesis protein MshJ [Arsukibacterium tuosuense]